MDFRRHRIDEPLHLDVGGDQVGNLLLVEVFQRLGSHERPPSHSRLFASSDRNAGRALRVARLSDGVCSGGRSAGWVQVIGPLLTTASLKRFMLWIVASRL